MKMLEELKEKVCRANKALVKYKLVLFTFGNVSAIDSEKKIIAIKPSGVAYETLIPEDIVLLDLKGNIIEGKKRPSSDTPTHLELYRNFKDVKAIVHTHSSYATIFAQAKKPIACLGTMHADYFYGEIPITRELTKQEIIGDYELNIGRLIVEYFNKSKTNPLNVPACLVASHGPFVWGSSIEKAINNAVILEQIAKMNIGALKINPNLNQINQFLLDKHYLRKHGKRAYYGQEH